MLGFRVQCLGFYDWLGVRVQGLGFYDWVHGAPTTPLYTTPLPPPPAPRFPPQLRPFREI